jgi:hypothetical protein
MSATRILDLAARGERETNRLCAGAIGVSASGNIDRRTAAPGMARRRLPPNRADHTQPNGDYLEVWPRSFTLSGSHQRGAQTNRGGQISEAGTARARRDLINAGPRGGPEGSVAPAGRSRNQHQPVGALIRRRSPRRRRWPGGLLLLWITGIVAQALIDRQLPFGHSAPARGYIEVNSTDVWITHSRGGSIAFCSAASVSIRSFAHAIKTERI